MPPKSDPPLKRCTPRVLYTAVALFVLLFLVFQSFWLARYPVNLEWVFREASTVFAGTQPPERIAYFWTYQANPLGYALIAAPLHWLPAPDAMQWSTPRLPSLAGSLLLVLGGLLLSREKKAPAFQSLIWTAALLVHPMIYLYAGQSTADILPTGLVFLALACCYRGIRQAPWHGAAVALFSVAVITKFNTALMGLGFWAIIFLMPRAENVSTRRRIAEAAAYLLIPLTCLALYFLWIFLRFDIFIISEPMKKVIDDDAAKFASPVIAIKYLSFCGLFCGPLALIPLLRWRQDFFHTSSFQTSLFLTVLLGLLSVISGLAIHRLAPGEMNYGSVLQTASGTLLASIEGLGLVLALILFADLIHHSWRYRDRMALVILAITLPYLLASSMTRPAQRYLILILPWLLWWLTSGPALPTRPLSRLWITLCWVGSLLLFIPLSGLGAAYLQAEGAAAERLGRYIADNQWSAVTHPGALTAHAGHYFPPEASFPGPPAEYAFQVRALPPGMPVPAAEGTELRREAVRFWGIHLRDYGLLRSPSLSVPPPESATFRKSPRHESTDDAKPLL